MAKEGKTIAGFLIGAAVGVAVGYILATDKDTRKDDLEKVKNALGNLKDKFAKKETMLDDDNIFNS